MECHVGGGMMNPNAYFEEEDYGLPGKASYMGGLGEEVHGEP